MITQDQTYQAIGYVMTSQLDGEKALKKKMAPKGLAKFLGKNRNLPFLQGYITCDTPNSNLYEFNGNFNFTKGNEYSSEVFSLTENNLLLKGSIISNTDWVVGIVVYTGDDTKLMMN